MARDDTVLANGTNKPFDPSSALTVIYGTEKPANINNKLTTVAIIVVTIAIVKTLTSLEILKIV
jgi:hypothetical protein